MKKLFTLPLKTASGKKLFTAITALLLLTFALSENMNAQTVVFSDDFNSVTSDTYTTSGAIGTSAWSVIRGGGDFGARRRATAPNCIELSNDVSGTANAANWVFAYTSTASYGSPYNTVLSSNPGIVTWTFNMKSNRTTALANPIGDLTKYSCAYVLGS